MFFIWFQGYGSIACPISLIRGKRSARAQQQTIEEQRAQIHNEIRRLKDRVKRFWFSTKIQRQSFCFQYPRHVPMSTQDKERLAQLEQQDVALFRNEESIIGVRESFCFKLRYVYRPFQMVVGFVLLCLALFIFISLLLSNINKCLHFVDFKQIFAQGNQTLPNPIDLLLGWTGKVRETNRRNLSFFKKISFLLSRFSFIHSVTSFYRPFSFTSF